MVTFWSYIYLLNWSYCGYMINDIYLESFIQRGKNRKEVLKILSRGKKTQAQIHKESGIYRTHVRRTIQEIMDKGLVVCPNPKDRIGKWYGLTSLGKKVHSSILKQN